MAHSQSDEDVATDELVDEYIHNLLAPTSGLTRENIGRPSEEDIIESQRRLLDHYSRHRHHSGDISQGRHPKPSESDSESFIMVEPGDLSLSDVSLQVESCNSFDRSPLTSPEAANCNPYKYSPGDSSEEKDLSSQGKKDRLIRRSTDQREVSSFPDLRTQNLGPPRRAQEYEADTESTEDLNRNPNLRLSSSLTRFFDDCEQHEGDAGHGEDPDDGNHVLVQTESIPSATDFIKEKSTGKPVFLTSSMSNVDSLKSDKAKVCKKRAKKGVAFVEAEDDRPRPDSVSHNMPKSPPPSATPHSAGLYTSKTNQGKSSSRSVAVDDAALSDALDRTNPFSPDYQDADTGAMEVSDAESNSQLQCLSNSHQRPAGGLLGGGQLIGGEYSQAGPSAPRSTFAVSPTVDSGFLQEVLGKVQTLESNYKNLQEAMNKRHCETRGTPTAVLMRRMERLVEERNHVQDVAERHLREVTMVQARMREELAQLSEDFTRAVAARLDRDGHLESRVVQQLLAAQQDRDKYLISVLERQDKINELSLLVGSQQLYIRDLEDRVFQQRLRESLTGTKQETRGTWDEDGDLAMDTRTSSYSDVINCGHAQFLPGTSTDGDSSMLDLFGYAG